MVRERHRKSFSDESDESDRSRERSKNRRYNRDSSRDGRDKEREKHDQKARKKTPLDFDEKFLEIGRLSRIDYSEDERSSTEKSKQKKKNENRGNSSPTRDRNTLKSRSKHAKDTSESRRLRSREDSDREVRRSSSRGKRHSDDSDYGDRRGTSAGRRGNRNRDERIEISRGRLGSEDRDERRGTSAGKRGNKDRDDKPGTSRGKRGARDREDEVDSPGLKKSGKSRRSSSSSEVSERQKSPDRAKDAINRRDKRNLQQTRHAGSDFEDVDLTPEPKACEDRLKGKFNEGFEAEDSAREENSESKDRRRNNKNFRDSTPDELSFRARELNQVPNMRSKLSQRTDMMMGVTDTDRALDSTDEFVRSSPKSLRVSTYLAAAIAIIEALFGIVLGIFLLIDAENQKITQYKRYMVYTYMLLHAFNLILSLLLVPANKKCQLDILVAWLAAQVGSGVIFIIGTIIYLIVDLAVAQKTVEEVIVGKQIFTFIYFSTVFLAFVFIKVLTIGVVILRYKKLTWIPRNTLPPENDDWRTFQSRETLAQENGNSIEMKNAPSRNGFTKRRNQEENEDSQTGQPTKSSVPEVTESLHDGTHKSSVTSVSDIVPEPLIIPRVTTDRTSKLLNRTGPPRSPSPEPNLPSAEPYNVRRKELQQETYYPKQGYSNAGFRTSRLELEPPYPSQEVSYSRDTPREEIIYSQRDNYPPPGRDRTYPRGEPNIPGRDEIYSKYGLSYRGQEPSFSKKEPYYPRQEPHYPRQEPHYSRRELQYPRPESCEVSGHDYASSRREMSPSRQESRSPVEPTYSRPLPSNARPISEKPVPPQRNLKGDDFYYSEDMKPAVPKPRYLPAGAVPAIGSPEDWKLSHSPHAYGMPHTRIQRLPDEVVHRQQTRDEPEPDY